MDMELVSRKSVVWQNFQSKEGHSSPATCSICSMLIGLVVARTLNYTQHGRCYNIWYETSERIRVVHEGISRQEPECSNFRYGKGETVTAKKWE